MLDAVLRRDHHHRNFLDLAVVVHRDQYVKAVHLRHDHIQQDKVDIGVRPQQLDRACAVFRLDTHFKVLFRAVRQDLTQQLGKLRIQFGIIYDQNRAFLFHSC